MDELEHTLLWIGIAAALIFILCLLVIVDLAREIPKVRGKKDRGKEKSIKGPILKGEDWVAKKRLKRKVDANGNVACPDCGKLCHPDQMSTFGYFEKAHMPYDAAVIYEDDYKEIIPDKLYKHTFSSVKDLCPSCADRHRTAKQEEKRAYAIIIVLFLLFLLTWLLAR